MLLYPTQMSILGQTSVAKLTDQRHNIKYLSISFSGGQGPGRADRGHEQEVGQRPDAGGLHRPARAGIGGTPGRRGVRGPGGDARATAGPEELVQTGQSEIGFGACFEQELSCHFKRD